MTPNSTSLTALQEPCETVQRFGDFQTIIKNLHPARVQQSIIERGVTSNRVAYSSASLRLCEFTSAYTKDNTYRVIELWLYDLSEFVGARGKLSPDQVKQLAVLLYSDAYILNFTELGLFFTRVKKGHYGDFYGTVDPVRIMSFLQQFLEERTSSVIQVNRDRENEDRKQSDIEWAKVREQMTEEDFATISSTINHFIKQLNR